MKWAVVTVIWFVAGSLFFLIHAHFGISFWDALYFIWEALLVLLLVNTIRHLLPTPSRWIIKPIFYYSIIRVLWEVVAVITKWDINHPKAVTLLFLVLITGVAILLIKDLAERWKQSQ